MSKLVAIAALALACTNCANVPRATSPTAPPLHLSPLSDLASPAGMTWMIEAHPRAVAANASLVPAVAELVSERELDEFTARYAVDPRQVEELIVASYAPIPPASTGEVSDSRKTELVLLRAVIDPAKIAAAFAARVLEVEGRAQDHAAPAANADATSTIIRTWGTLATTNERAQVATFGVSAAGLEIGKLGPLRVAELFAEEKLRRASPALKASPLKDTLDKLGNAPAALRLFFPGPFVGASGQSLGGLLAGATAAAVAVRVKDGARPTLDCTLVLTGAWGADAQAAGDRLDAAFHVLATSLSGKLLRLDSYARSPNVVASADALTLEVEYDAETLAHALHLATSGSLEQLLSPSAQHPH